MRHADETRQKRARPVHRPLVGIAADGASSFGRGVTRGVMQYANAHRRWEIHTALRRTFEATFEWPLCTGAILAGVGPALSDEIYANTRHVVSCSGSSDPATAVMVCLDDVAVGRVAAEHLIECRLKHFSYYGRRSSNHSINRERGFVAALAERNFSCIQCPIQYQHPLDTPFEAPVLDGWLQGLPKPAGILAVDDTAALDLATRCRHLNIGIPEQLAVVGVNNDDLICDTAWSPLSSVDCGFPRLGFAAAQLLERMMDGEKLRAEHRHLLLPPLQVVRRLSTDILAVDEPLLADAIRYIREHACDPCSVDEILRHVPAGRRWLERQFEAKLGRSPRGEILRVQLETAKRLLLQPGLTLPDIAERCGFSGAPTLGRAFLRAEGDTPASYRRTALRRMD